LSDTLVSSIEERADKFPEQVIISLDSINLQTQEFRGLLKVLATKLKNVITPESLNRYYKSIYLTIVDRESSLFWQEWLNGQNLNFRQSTRFIEDFDIEYPITHIPKSFPLQLRQHQFLPLLVDQVRT
jgi:hypothetical protein